LRQDEENLPTPFQAAAYKTQKNKKERNRDLKCLRI